MRKHFILFILLVLSMSTPVLACTDDSATSTIASLDMSGSFEAGGTSNPIDKAYLADKSAAVTTSDIIAVETKYLNAWKTQLQYVYGGLLLNMDIKYRSDLRAAQQAWVTWNSSESTLLNSYLADKQGTVWGIVGASNARARYRERALEVMALYYDVTQHAEWLMDSQSSSATNS